MIHRGPSFVSFRGGHSSGAKPNSEDEEGTDQVRFKRTLKSTRVPELGQVSVSEIQRKTEPR
jgi:hypothetical protein